MLDIEQRVKMVEERMADHMRLFAEIKQGLMQFEERVDRRFEQVDRRFEQIDARLTGLDQKVDAGLSAMNQKIEAGLLAVNQKIDAGLSGVNHRIDSLGLTLHAALTTQRNEMHAQFRWTAGIVLTGLVAIVAAILAR